MGILGTLLIVAVVPTPSIEARTPDAETVYACGFEADADHDYDEWPDLWTRRRGQGYPHYNRASIRTTRANEGHRALAVELDGGGAAIYSPLVEVDRRYRYELDLRVLLERIERDEVFATIEFLDAQRQSVAVHASERIRRADDWRRLRVGPLDVSHEQAKYARIGLHVEPGVRADLSGVVYWDRLCLARLPRLAMAPDRPWGLYHVGQQAEVRMTLSGAVARRPDLELELVDADGQVVDRQRLQTSAAVAARAAETVVAEAALPLVTPAPADAVELRWTHRFAEPGYYRLRVLWHTAEGPRFVRELPLGVIEPGEWARGGEFGWTLPRSRLSDDPQALAELLAHCGVTWAKVPLWLDESDRAGAERLTLLGDRLRARGVDLVAVLDRAPPQVREQLQLSEQAPLARTLNGDPQVWGPSLDVTVARFALVASAWQLGADGDLSFMGHPGLTAKLTDIKARLDRIGQDLKVGLVWDWDSGPPGGNDPVWQFIALRSGVPPTARELDDYLAAVTPTAARPVWIELAPLSADDYAATDRVTDLVRRMIVARQRGAARVYVPEALSGPRGLVHDDNTISDLLLPWRTTALYLSGSAYLGQLKLPGGSPNAVFERNGELVLVAWNDRPQIETLYLGPQVRATDVWGRTREVPSSADGQTLALGPTPVFLTGLQPEIARWRLAFRWQTPALPSILGTPQTVGWETVNGFARPVQARVRWATDPGWVVTPAPLEADLEPGEPWSPAQQLTLPLTAVGGRRPIELEFEIEGEETYRFRVYESLQIGQDDVTIEATCRLLPGDVLRVEQRLVNRTPRRVSFRCHLFAPGHRRLRIVASDLPPGEHVQVYELADGGALWSQPLWLRAEEIDGPRVISLQFVPAEL